LLFSQPSKRTRQAAAIEDRRNAARIAPIAGSHEEIRIGMLV
jgi:hypothetical protein